MATELLQWIPEDDLLLKNAVEAGASLEALAKGAVIFSRRYTLQELRERWHSLLYDADVSLQACDYMFELGISGINSGSRFRPDFIRNREVKKKRKFYRIRRKYYAMRKRLRSVGFLEPNPVVLGGHGSDSILDGNRLDQDCVLGDSGTDHLELREEDLDILRHAFPEAIEDVAGPSGATNVCQTGCPDSLKEGPGSRIMGGYGFDKGLVSATLEGRNNFLDAGIDSSLALRNCQVNGIPESFHPPNSEDFSEFQTMVFQPDQPPFETMICCGGGKESNAAVYTGEFADAYSLLNLSDEDEMFDFDEKTAKDKCAITDPDSVIQDLIKDRPGVSAVKEEPQVLTASGVNLGSATTVDPFVSEVCPPICQEQVATPPPKVDLPKDDVADKTNPDPDFCELSGSKIICVLNTEDPEIPCNDDIFLLIHPNASLCPSDAQLDTSIPLNATSCLDEKDHKATCNLSAKDKDSTKPSSWPSGVILESHPVRQLVVQGGPEIHNSGSRALLPESYSMTVGETTGVRSTYSIQNRSSDTLGQREVPGVDQVEGNRAAVTTMIRSTEVGFPRNRFPEAAADSLVSDIEDSLMDDGVPYFSDIEAMILEMDLEPYDEDAHITNEVASYQYEETKRTIIRLEQAARSCLQRTMTSQGALAILYGRHSRHYIRKTKVILGRSTEDVGVDIDLAKEGQANKISRRQAVIKMESDGSFILKNLGRSSVLVNGMTRTTGQYLNLSSGCFIEIKGLGFVFEINQGYLKKQLGNLVRR